MLQVFHAMHRGELWHVEITQYKDILFKSYTCNLFVNQLVVAAFFKAKKSSISFCIINQENARDVLKENNQWSHAIVLVWQIICTEFLNRFC